AREPDGRRLGGIHTEQSGLSCLSLFLRACRMREDRLGGIEHSRPLILEGIEGARSSEALQLPSVQQPWIDPRGEVFEALERAAARPFRDELVHRLLADPLQRAECIANRAILDREMSIAGVDVGWKALDLAAAHVLD